MLLLACQKSGVCVTIVRSGLLFLRCLGGCRLSGGKARSLKGIEGGRMQFIELGLKTKFIKIVRTLGFNVLNHHMKQKTWFFDISRGKFENEFYICKTNTECGRQVNIL